MADAVKAVRTVVDHPLLIVRDGDGIAALQDRCPHRLVPLSMGRLSEGRIQCIYHGLTFDFAGNCIANPHGPATAASGFRASRRLSVTASFGFGSATLQRPTPRAFPTSR